ncbi:MAG TPA: hypothetical protein VFN27_04630 [Xanthobacteraceae bacterium]|nr:hypothetical protein [Xanthobacteraceae bacterium]
MRNSPRQMRCPGTLRTGSVMSLAASALLLAGADAARSGPCAEDIILLERQIAATVPGPQTGPTGTQTIGAQLHRQPTPGSVEQAEHVANKDADEALARAKQADSDGNSADCNAALKRARELYGIF